MTGIPPHMKPGPLWIYGASSHGLVIAEAAAAADWNVQGFLDDHTPAGGMHASWPVKHPSHIAPQAGVKLIIAIGDNAVRHDLFHRMQAAGWAMASILHPRAWVSPSAAISQGVYVGPMAAINAQARLDDGVIVNTSSVVEHHCHLKAFCHACPRSAMAGHVTIGRRTLLGTGAAVRPRITIGDNCIIGAGAAVVADLPDDTTAMGVPAKAVQRVR